MRSTPGRGRMPASTGMAGSPQALRSGPPASSSGHSRGSSSWWAKAPTPSCSSWARCSSRWPPRSSCARERCESIVASATQRGGARRSSSSARCSSTPARSTPCRPVSRPTSRIAWSGGPTCRLGLLPRIRRAGLSRDDGRTPHGRDQPGGLRAVLDRRRRVLRVALDGLGAGARAGQLGDGARGPLLLHRRGGAVAWPCPPRQRRRPATATQGGMTVPTPAQTASAPPGHEAIARELDALARDYGNRFLHEPAPDHRIPPKGMRSVDAMRLVGEELVLDGIPMRNLATFVTTWMEPEAQRVIADNLHRNYIDHAEYPQTAEIEQRCIRMLADLFNAPGETTGTRTQGSSEAIMLGALSLKWKWRARREAAGKPTDRPNLVFGGDVHVVWDKFCRYFDVEPRVIALQPDRFTIGPEDVEPHIDENTIGVAAVLGTTFTGHADDIVGINDLLGRLRDEKGLEVPLHVDAASGGFVWPFLYPDSPWDFRLEQVRSINASGHKFGLVYPGIGWLIFREQTDLAEDLVFYENYLGKRDATFTLNFSTGSSMVLAQYYNFIRLGHSGYTYVMEVMQNNAKLLADEITKIGRFKVIGSGEEQLPLVA